MAAIIAGVPGEDVDGISHGGWPAWLKNNKHGGCYFSVSFFKRSICGVSRSCYAEAFWFNGNDYTVCRMWAILLGCILRD